MLSEDEVQEALIGHQQRNVELLESLREKGVGLDKPRAIAHHFWATSQRDAAALGKDLYERGFLVLLMARHDPGDGSEFWNVEAEFEQAPEEAASGTVVEGLVRIAGSHEALYDGWGTEV